MHNGLPRPGALSIKCTASDCCVPLNGQGRWWSSPDPPFLPPTRLGGKRPRMLQSPPLRSQGRLPLPVRPPRVALPLGRLGARDAAAPARLARWAAGGPGSMAQFQAPKGSRTYILPFGTAHPLPLAPRSEWRIPAHAGVCSSDWSGRELVVSR